jgi:hypothetical protein
MQLQLQISGRGSRREPALIALNSQPSVLSRFDPHLERELGKKHHFDKTNPNQKSQYPFHQPDTEKMPKKTNPKLASSRIYVALQFQPEADIFNIFVCLCSVELVVQCLQFNLHPSQSNSI